MNCKRFGTPVTLRVSLSYASNCQQSTTPANASTRAMRLRGSGLLHTRTPREVPLPDSLRAMLARLVEGRAASDYLFPREHVIRKAWAAICTAAGVSDAHLHDWRRTSARDKRAAGVPTSIILAIHGWSTESIFRRYAIVALPEMRAALEISYDLLRSKIRRSQNPRK